jgi:transcriptional regulator with XRE-family HTH domain
MNVVGNRIKRIREQAGLTQEDMAGCFGITQSNYGRLEKDDERITVTRLKTLASILEVSTDYLLHGIEDTRNTAMPYEVLTTKDLTVEVRIYKVA